MSVPLKMSLILENESWAWFITLWQVKAESLAILGLFAYLGRRTRLHLSKMGIREVDEQVKDFLGYVWLHSKAIALSLLAFWC